MLSIFQIVSLQAHDLSVSSQCRLHECPPAVERSLSVCVVSYSHSAAIVGVFLGSVWAGVFYYSQLVSEGCESNCCCELCTCCHVCWRQLIWIGWFLLWGSFFLPFFFFTWMQVLVSCIKMEEILLVVRSNDRLKKKEYLVYEGLVDALDFNQFLFWWANILNPKNLLLTTTQALF